MCSCVNLKSVFHQNDVDQENIVLATIKNTSDSVEHPANKRQR